MKGPLRRGHPERTTPKGPSQNGMSLRAPLVLYINCNLYQLIQQINHSLNLFLSFYFHSNTLSDTLVLLLSAREHAGGLSNLTRRPHSPEKHTTRRVPPLPQASSTPSPRQTRREELSVFGLQETRQESGREDVESILCTTTAKANRN